MDNMHLVGCVISKYHPSEKDLVAHVGDGVPIEGLCN